LITIKISNVFIIPLASKSPSYPFAVDIPLIPALGKYWFDFFHPNLLFACSKPLSKWNHLVCTLVLLLSLSKIFLSSIKYVH
jgi:hypothetical protein